MPIRTRRAVITPKRAETVQERSLVASRLNRGMITTIDPVDIPDAATSSSKNVRIRFDVTRRRPGLVQFGNTIGEADKKVVTFAEFKENDSTNHRFMFTPSAVYELINETWTIYTGSALAGTRIQPLTFFNDFYFANGANIIQKVDVGARTYADAGNASLVGNMKYITGFFNRIVGFNDAVGDPTLIAWSADSKGDEWDPTVDISAGSAPLIDSPSDRADFGTGIFAFDNIIVLLRERSIWLGNKQPIASLPFNFYTQVPGQGCDAPHSAKIFGNSIFYVDTRTRGIFVYQVGAQTPQRISDNIEGTFFSNLDDPREIFATIDRTRNEYLVGYPITGTNTVRIFIFNLLDQAWSFDEIDNTTALGTYEPSDTGVLAIDLLIGSIDDLTGTIDGLVPTEVSDSQILIGKSSGLAAAFDDAANDDLGIAFETEVISKDFAVEEDTIYITKIRIDFGILSTVTLQLSYSIDNGATFIIAKTQTFSETRARNRLSFRKNIQAKYLRWRVTTSGGNFFLFGYEINISPGGDVL